MNISNETEHSPLLSRNGNCRAFKWVYLQAFKIRYQSLNTLYERLSNDPTMGFTDAVNVLGVKVILFLQATFPSWANFFMKVSRIGDPSLAFTFYFPLTAALDLRQGTYLLWTLILCEWFNMILKWVLAGDRPYWWVHEAPYYIHKNLPFVRQYPMTCETGPGMPSGHSTLNAALFFILVRGLTSFLQPRLRRVFSEKKCLWINRVIWMIYGSWIGLVMVSRIFIGTHFPHQCVAGALIGITTALWVNYTNVFDAMTQKKSFLITAVMLTTVGGVFGTYRTLGNDPMWSVNKAVRWCLKREFIHIDSIPFYALSRYSGQSLGLGLALASSSFAQVNPSRFSWKMKLSLAILTLTAGQASDFLHRILPPTLVGYYVLEFLLNASLAYLVITLLPKLVMRSSGVKSKAKAKKP